MNQTSISPKNGPFSGMILTAATTILIIPLGLFYEPFAEKLNQPLTLKLQNYFLLSIVLMGIHKIESFFSKEYDHCPVYLTSGNAPWTENPRKMIFLTFVPTFVGMLLFVYLAFLGQPWHLMILAIWISQGLHEIHHLGKSLARRQIYPGLYSSLAFVFVMSFAIFPLWHDVVFVKRGFFFQVYYLILPLVLAAFYFEDRLWLQKALHFFPTLSENKSQKAWEKPRKPNA